MHADTGVRHATVDCLRRIMRGLPRMRNPLVQGVAAFATRLPDDCPEVRLPKVTCFSRLTIQTSFISDNVYSVFPLFLTLWARLCINKKTAALHHARPAQNVQPPGAGRRHFRHLPARRLAQGVSAEFEILLLTIQPLFKSDHLLLPIYLRVFIYLSFPVSSLC